MIQFATEWVGLEVLSRFFLEILQGGIEYGSESGETGGRVARIGHRTNGNIRELLDHARRVED